MNDFRFCPKHLTTSLIKSCTETRQIKRIHSQLLVNGFLNNRLLNEIAGAVAINHPAFLDYANKILNQCRNPTIFTFNTLIRAQSRSPTPHKCFDLYEQILRSPRSPDNYTLTFLIRTCTQVFACEAGSSLHSAVIKHGLESDPHVQSGLINMYSEFGFLECSRRVFTDVPEPDLVTQTAMASAACKCGVLGLARKVFDEMPHRDSVAWSSMISGYVLCGQSREALRVFHWMQKEDVDANESCMVSVLSASAHLGALDQGRWAHAYIEKTALRVNVTLGTALVDMYAKCGDMDKAMEVFWGLNEKNVYTWSSAMGGLAMNGAGGRCLELFSLMKQEGVRPNEVTFVSVLRGCAVAGLVEEGLGHFHSMKNVYGIEPLPEHYGCMVDLYGRAGCLEEALDFINSMPMKPHVGAWGALLSACRIHRNMELGKLASEKMVEMEASNHGAYVLLSNIYAEYKKWDNVGDVREKMRSNGVRKVPGCSVMAVDGEVHEFIVGDKRHPRYDEIMEMVKEMSRRLRIFGYVPNTRPVMFDVEEEEKEGALHQHTEKVAIAFGLMSLKESAAIRIVKNLRVCGDCHDFTKLVSRIFKREVIVRDRNRFHHFKDGECSCMGYW